MKTKMFAAAVVVAAIMLPGTAAIADDHKAEKVMNEEVGVPVFPYDITDKPYKIVGPVKAGVRKATIFSKEPSQEKIYKELWERGEKMDADAVVNASYGDSHMTAFSWGKTNALGIAVRFLTKEEIAAGETGDTAPASADFTEEMFENANRKPD